MRGVVAAAVVGSLAIAAPIEEGAKTVSFCLTASEPQN